MHHHQHKSYLLQLRTPIQFEKLNSREKIPHKTRQLITVSALTVLVRPDELKLHIHAALNVGCTKEEVAEVIFQTSIYGGVPSANTALTVLKEVLEEREEE